MSSTAASVSQLTPATDNALPLRFVTAASLFDGHDASINIIRRMLQARGVEVIHLGHNRSVLEIARAAIDEDADGICVSSYQGGHVEYFRFMLDTLNEMGGESIAVFGGGGGVIIPQEIADLHDYGVEQIYSPEDGMSLGLTGMIEDIISRTHARVMQRTDRPELPEAGNRLALSHLISSIVDETADDNLLGTLRDQCEQLPTRVPVLGITGTGGSGKSSLTDELVRRFRLDQNDQLKLALVAIDPTRRKTGGALLGDRIRMNAINSPQIYMRSIATRDAGGEVPACMPDIVAALQLSGFDLIVIETPGIGQGDAGIVPFSDVSLYVMTPEFGAASQLEKIDMLDYADLVALNKFERKGAEDALRDVRKQMQRNSERFDVAPEELPVFGTIAARFNDDGVTALYQALKSMLAEKGAIFSAGKLPEVSTRQSTRQQMIIPGERIRYLAEVAETVRHYKVTVASQAQIASELQALETSLSLLATDQSGNGDATLQALAEKKRSALSDESRQLLQGWPAMRENYQQSELTQTVRDKTLKTQLRVTTMAGTEINRVSLPRYRDEGDLLSFLSLENLPGYFPYTAGVFPFKRENEDPTRMFAGEGDAFRTNARFKTLSEHAEAKRLSTAFDSVTLYGQDPDERPDIYGKVGNSGVSIATVEDMEVLYDGFDLCDPMTSVSMTINGPAPTILAFFFTTALRQQINRFIEIHDRDPDDNELAEIQSWTCENIRGTVQADILKEDQGQNTCIFSTEFSLKLMGDIQEWFVENNVRNFYSVSISGYHIAEAGANPITQLALTLANGFTYIEAYLARGMHIDDFAPNLSFFFSNGMDPEYTVLGRVARRIWAVTLRDKYGANARSQKLKYHIQTSGRSLHAQEMSFNDIRTTLQALIAVYDNCNSLHTNAYDEAVTTPTGESVRRAIAIQLVINKEWGLAKNENPLQGSFIIDELTELVEEAVLSEFVRLSDRGGVLGAMETGYQRGKIQDESLYYEHKKHDGSLPIVGVNTFRGDDSDNMPEITLARSTDEEKQSQLTRLRDFQSRQQGNTEAALAHLQEVAMQDGNLFAALMEAAPHCSLGQITEALFDVGGQYRRSM